MVVHYSGAMTSVLSVLFFGEATVSLLTALLEWPCLALMCGSNAGNIIQILNHLLTEQNFGEFERKFKILLRL